MKDSAEPKIQKLKDEKKSLLRKIEKIDKSITSIKMANIGVDEAFSSLTLNMNAGEFHIQGFNPSKNTLSKFKRCISACKKVLRIRSETLNIEIGAQVDLIVDVGTSYIDTKLLDGPMISYGKAYVDLVEYALLDHVVENIQRLLVTHPEVMMHIKKERDAMFDAFLKTRDFVKSIAADLNDEVSDKKAEELAFSFVIRNTCFSVGQPNY